MELVNRLSVSIAGRARVALIALLLLLAPLVSCAIPQTLQLTTIDLGIPAAALNSPVVGQLPDTTPLHVRVTFKIDPNLLKQAQQQKIQPGQPSHLEQFAQKLGIDSATYQKIKDFFSAQGIALKLSKLRTHLALEGKAKTFSTVLQTKFVVHKYNNHTFFAPDSPIKLPTSIANSIDAITGLDNYSSPPQHDFAMYFNSPLTGQHPAQDCYPLDQTLLPREVAHAYGFDQLWNNGWNGQNMTVNLVEVDGSYVSDIQNYFDCIQFKGHLKTINIDGKPRDALGESTLDIQMVAGLARSININVYQTDASNSDSDIWTQVNDMLQQIIDDNVNNANAGSVVSLSLGDAEQEISQADMRAIDQSIQQLTEVEHMRVFIASGDCGAFTNGVYGQLAVSFPASDPWAVSVGGTILQIDQNGNRANEVVWSDSSNQSSCKNRWGSGGGNSGVFSRMNWQNAPGVNNRFSQGNHRQIPDVSAVAYALAVYYNGQWGAVGGTSAAAPIWATGLALVNQGLLQHSRSFNFSPELFYQTNNRSSGLHPYYDVTNGNNLYYPATPGWDYATGLGTPNLADFYRVMLANS
ncbi:MAG TPA: S53 family peptidase [Ktedonobacteraceae bacterium]|nr:S53 family peptidase [Ktedonobacteraceae bacterium]